MDETIDLTPPEKPHGSKVPVTVTLLVCLAASGAGAWYGLRLYDRQGQSLDECQSKLDKKGQALAAATKDGADLKSGLADCQTKETLLASQLGETGTNLQSTQTQLADLQRQQAATRERIAEYARLAAQLKKMTDAGKISVRIRHGKMVVNLPEGVLFDSGKADVKKDGHDTLLQVARALAALHGRDIVVAGHTDDQSIHSKEFASNWELSVARALAVEKILEKDGGLSPRHLAVAGYAEFDPVATNDTVKGRAENRRIELVIMPNLAELPEIPEDLTKPVLAQAAAGKAGGAPKKP